MIPNETGRVNRFTGFGRQVLSGEEGYGTPSAPEPAGEGFLWTLYQLEDYVQNAKLTAHRT